MQKFCHNCGKQLVAGAKFCPFCGTDLGSLLNSKASAQPAPAPKANSQFTPFAIGKDDDDSDAYLDRLEHVDIRQDALHVEIVRDRPLGETVGSLVAQALQSGPPAAIENRPSPYASSEACLTEFKQEAGTMRTNAK
jgi:zinc-ribbon domain